MGCAAAEDNERREEAKQVDILIAARDGKLDELELVCTYLPNRVNHSRAEKVMGSYSALRLPPCCLGLEPLTRAYRVRPVTAGCWLLAFQLIDIGPILTECYDTATS